MEERAEQGCDPGLRDNQRGLKKHYSAVPITRSTEPDYGREKSKTQKNREPLLQQDTKPHKSIMLYADS